MMTAPRALILLLAGFASLNNPVATRAADPVDFRRDVRPILADHCFQCHGPDEATRKGGLRLDVRDEALKPAKSGDPAIVPGKPDESAILFRVTADDTEQVMPPPKQKDPLKPAEVETLRRWIAQGAPYAGHWGFLPPEKPTVPAVDPARFTVRNPIDAFVAARLEKERLAMSPQAPAEVLCRRIYLDLVGLAPSPAELDAFVRAADRDRQAAVAELVERLLASEHFGEKWARHWLDVARYADSDGYEKDLPRQQWAYRDWVIRALNRDLPYDRFLIEQVAGDLLPGASQDQVVATGFLRNGMVNEEGAILAEQFRMEGLFDRMDCLGKAVLGLSIQCAQCHTHKFDPISHTEYYRLFAFLNNDYEATSQVFSRESLEQIDKIRSGVAAIEERLRREHSDWPERLARWEDERRAQRIGWDVLTPIEPEWIGGLAHPDVLPDGSVLTLGFRPTRGELILTAKTTQTGLTGLRLEALTHGDLPFGGPGRSEQGTFAVSELEVEAAPASADDKPKWQKLALVEATSDQPIPERPIEPFFRTGADDKRRVGPAAFLVDGKEDTAWSPDRGPGRRNTSAVMGARFKEPVGFPEGTRLKFTFKYRHGGSDIHGRQNNFLGRFRLSATTAASPSAEPISPEAAEALGVPDDRRTPAQRAEVFAAWRQNEPEFKPLNDEIDALWRTFPAAETTVLNLAARRPEHARETFLLDRGAWDKPRTKVTPGVPAALHPMPAGAPADRLGLALWLADRRSPTTARVAVNRAWQAVFGTGLVETAEDFGTRGQPPSHPELLDWLAVEFMDRGWSLKQLLRTVVTSATYQQSSRMTHELLERDPRNRLLARGPRFRAEAEVVRDVALGASGLLNSKVGGPSVFPPVPASQFAQSFLKIDFWKTAEGPDRYRRSLYVFRRRSQPDPALSTFDAPNGDFACPRRVRSNTPLAALAAMNEPVFVEAARALAMRVLREGGKTDADRAEYGFRLCTGRAPKPGERDAMLELLTSRRARLADGWLSAWEVSTGDATKLPALPPGANPQDAAAWTIVARVLLNLDETLTKN